MTVGQMLQLTQRFNQILGASQALKNRRLQSLANDIEDAFITYGPNQDIFATGLACAVYDEMEG